MLRPISSHIRPPTHWKYGDNYARCAGGWEVIDPRSGDRIFYVADGTPVKDAFEDPRAERSSTEEPTTRGGAPATSGDD